MKRSYRLGRGADLASLLRQGRRISSPLFYAATLANGLGQSRFAFIVPRTTDKRAFIRNRLRRRMREYIRTRPNYTIPSLDIAITCKKEAAEAPRVQFYAAFKELLIRIQQR